MGSYFSRTTIIGFVSGIGVAAFSTLLVSLMPERNEYLDTLINVLAGLPVLLVRRLEAPLPFYYSVFFIYSGLNGVTVAQLLGRCRFTGR